MELCNVRVYRMKDCVAHHNRRGIYGVTFFTDMGCNGLRRQDNQDTGPHKRRDALCSHRAGHIGSLCHALLAVSRPHGNNGHYLCLTHQTKSN